MLINASRQKPLGFRTTTSIGETTRTVSRAFYRERMDALAETLG